MDVDVKKTTNQKRNVLIAIIMFAIVAVVLSIVFTGVVPEKTYEKNYALAIAELESQNYEEAFQYFNDLPYFEEVDTNEFYISYITSLCEKDEYLTAYLAMSGGFLPDEALNLVSDETIKNMEYYVRHREAIFWSTTGSYVDAYYQFLQLGGYEDSSIRAVSILEHQKSAFYDEAVKQLEEMTASSVERALSLFELIPEYEDSSWYVDMIRFMNNMCGTYTKSGILDNDATYIIEYCKITRYEDDYKTTSTMRIVEDDGVFYYVTNDPIPLTTIFMYKTNANVFGAYWRYSESGYQTDFERMRKESSSTEQLKAPEIGMTADEVKKSTWGEPTKINKTTYSWGTSEQWVYSNYRYIYFENGIVTAIQEFGN